MFEVFKKRIIAALPTIEAFVAEVARHIVGTGNAGVEEETGAGELSIRQVSVLGS